ncbi:MAG: hypothetical protein ACFFA6_05225 [Promethearchaeota archaeon]
MPLLKKATILFDLSHNEMLHIEEEEFSELLRLLQQLNIKIKKNEDRELSKEVLQDVDILIIGNPIDDYFSNIEIKAIVDYVRIGGNLLLLSEYGADFLQKTNLNDISNIHFGINFQKNLIKEQNSINQNCTSIVHIQRFKNKYIANGLREVIIGGACSLFLSKDAKPLLMTNEVSVWTERYNNSNEQWIREGEEEEKILGAYTEYGQGKVVALGDIDIFTNDSNIGLNRLDNQLLITNILKWLIEPVKETEVIKFTLTQLGEFQNNIKNINKKIDNIIETMTILENRISVIEDKSDIVKSEKEIKDLVEKKPSQGD